MSSASGRISGNSQRCGSSGATMPTPSLSWHHHPHPVQQRALASWMATSPPSASALPHSPSSLPTFLPSTTRGALITTAAVARTSACPAPRPRATADDDGSAPTSAAAARRSICGSGRGPSDPTNIPPHSSPASAPASLKPTRWPAPARSRVVRSSSAVSSPPAPGANASGPGPGPGAATVRPPSPSWSSTTNNYFDGFCPEGATECSPLWGQLRWCSTWQQMKQLYDNLLRAEAAAVASAAAAAVATTSKPSTGSGGNGGDSASSSSYSVDITPEAIAAALNAAAGSAGGPAATAAVFAGPDGTVSSVGGSTRSSGSVVRAPDGGPLSPTAPGLLSRDETYGFLLQLQDFYHLKLDEDKLDELQAFRCRLVRDLAVYVRRLDAEQLEALCCASAVSGKCLSRDRADAVQERLLKILTTNNNGNNSNNHDASHGAGTGPTTSTTSTSGANSHNHHHQHANGHVRAHANGADGNGVSSSGHGPTSASSSAAAAAAGFPSSAPASSSRRGRPSSVGGFQVLTPALNIIFALYDHGYLPQVALLQAVFRQAVDHCTEVTRSQWHGLYGLARRFRFLVDDLWLDDLHAHLRDPLSCSTDFGRLASILGCISAFSANKAMEALDTRVLVVVEAIERRYDEGRSVLTAHQLCCFTALLVDMQSPFRSKWLSHCLDHLGSCRSHLAGLPPGTLVLAVELVLRGRGWDDQRLLSKLLRQLFSTYALHPSATLRARSNVGGCPPRTASRIITASSSPSSAAAGPAPPLSLSAMAAAAAWDVEVGGAGGAASPPLDLASIVDWLASKVPSAPGPERSNTLEDLEPLVSEFVESNRRHLASLEPRRIPGLIKAVALLGYSPSREWVSEAFTYVAGGADTLSGGELVAMLRVSHAQRLPLPHATLDAVCAQHARILPLMRAVDLQRLLECWVADRYVPSQEQLQGFFDAVCDVFGIDIYALKAPSSPASGPSSNAGSMGSTSDTQTLMSFDSDLAAALSGSGGAAGGIGEVGEGSLSGRRIQGVRNGAGGAGSSTPLTLVELGMLQTAGGVVSAGAADGVAGAMVGSNATTPTSSSSSPSSWRLQPQPQSPPNDRNPKITTTAAAPPSVSVSGSGGEGARTHGSPSSSSTSSPLSTASADDVLAAAAAAAVARGRPSSSLGSLDGRPKGSLLQPGEAQSMLNLLEQYRLLLLEAKRSDLLIVMNTYRNAVTAALHEMRKPAVSAKPVPNSRLLQAVLRGTAQALPPAATTTPTAAGRRT